MMTQHKDKTQQYLNINNFELLKKKSSAKKKKLRKFPKMNMDF